MSKKATPDNRRLLSLTAEHWESMYSLRERLENLTPPGIDAPAVEEVGRNAMSLGLKALEQKMRRQESKLKKKED